jgi:hypothetical protein
MCNAGWELQHHIQLQNAVQVCMPPGGQHKLVQAFEFQMVTQCFDQGTDAVGPFRSQSWEIAFFHKGYGFDQISHP